MICVRRGTLGLSAHTPARLALLSEDQSRAMARPCTVQVAVGKVKREGGFRACESSRQGATTTPTALPSESV